jgi:mannose/fructose/N-acetylgalactosamine-specific phosphotransferase system component IIB
VAEAAEAALKEEPKGRSLFLFSNPTDVAEFIAKGGPASSVNVGGMHFFEGKNQVCKVVCVDDRDVAAFKELKKKGIELEIRAAPGDLREMLEKYIPELKDV